MTAYVKELLFGTKSTPTKEESAADDEISSDEILSFGDGSEISEDGRESTNTIDETCESDSDKSVGQESQTIVSKSDNGGDSGSKDSSISDEVISSSEIDESSEEDGSSEESATGESEKDCQNDSDQPDISDNTVNDGCIPKTETTTKYTQIQDPFLSSSAAIDRTKQFQIQSNFKRLLQADITMPASSAMQKEWHRVITNNQREHAILGTVNAIFPSPDPSTMLNDSRIKELISWAKKVENGIFEHSEDEDEYYRLLVEKIGKVQKDLQEKMAKRLNEQSRDVYVHQNSIEIEQTIFTAGVALTKLTLPSGKYYIRSESPWQGYLQGKFCYISEKATKPGQSALFDVVTVDGSAGFVYFRSTFFDGNNLLSVSKKDKMAEKNATTLEEEEHFTGRLFLSAENTNNLGAAQFELFVPPMNSGNVAKNVRAIIRSVNNQRFLSVKSGGSPFATEKDPLLATVFILERDLSMNSSKVSKIALPSPGIYHIRIGNVCDERLFYHGYLTENEFSNGLVTAIESSRKGLFHLSHNNDDGTISLFSLARNEYITATSNRIGFNNSDKIAKFELRQPELPSSGAVKLLVGVGMKFLAVTNNGSYLFDDEKYGYLFEFLPVKALPVNGI